MFYNTAKKKKHSNLVSLEDFKIIGKGTLE